MIWWFFLFLYGICCQQGVFRICCMWQPYCFRFIIVNRSDENVYKNVMDIFDTECSIVGIPCYFFFGRPELTSKTQKRMARIVEAYAPLRPENELLNETLRLTDMDAYRQSRLINSKSEISTVCGGLHSKYFKSGVGGFESHFKRFKVSLKSLSLWSIS